MVRWSEARIPQDLADRIEAVREDAGYNSKSDFVAEAIRELLEKYEKSRFEHMNFEENIIRLIDNERPRGTPYIELFLKKDTLRCSSCETSDCIHIQACWTDPKIRERLEAKDLRPHI